MRIVSRSLNALGRLHTRANLYFHFQWKWNQLIRGSSVETQSEADARC